MPIVLLVAGVLVGALLNYVADVLPGKAPDGWQPLRTRRHGVVLAATPLALVAVWYWANGHWPGQPWPEFWPAAVLVVAALVVAVIDIEHRLIFPLVVIPAGAAIFVLGSLVYFGGYLRTLSGGVIGFGVVYLIYLGGKAYGVAHARRTGRALEDVAFGGGDPLLAGMLGLANGIIGIWPALLIAVATAGVFSVGFMVWRARQERPVAGFIPYGPFLLLGSLLVYFAMPGWL